MDELYLDQIPNRSFIWSDQNQRSLSFRVSKIIFVSLNLLDRLFTWKIH